MTTTQNTAAIDLVALDAEWKAATTDEERAAVIARAEALGDAEAAALADDDSVVAPLPVEQLHLERAPDGGVRVRLGSHEETYDREVVNRIRASYPPLTLVSESAKVDGKVFRLDHRRAVLEVTGGDKVLHSVRVADPSRGLLTAVREERARLHDLAAEQRRRGGWVIAKDVKRERVEWLWPRRIPFAKVTLLDGGHCVHTSVMDFVVAAIEERLARVGKRKKNVE